MGLGGGFFFVFKLTKEILVINYYMNILVEERERPWNDSLVLIPKK